MTDYKKIIDFNRLAGVAPGEKIATKFVTANCKDGCGNNGAGVPDEVITPDKLVDIKYPYLENKVSSASHQLGLGFSLGKTIIRGRIYLVVE
ncbi:hypothetical protein [Photobacterium leiognathi]|uniref:hypothetical protein n=1 Tax=Photobacterium leiognathi TaxID=553611 RepID=UPI002981D521|nr:hypothetical protein [Photobacterium leiognathi]